MPKETREKISSSHKGKIRTASHKAAISARLKGKARSKEARAAISARLKGKARTKEARAAISAGVKRKVRSPERQAEINAAISASLKGKARSPEAREAISAGVTNKKAVIITLNTVEIQCTSLTNAGKEMGVRPQIISKLVHKIMKKGTSKGGVYAGKFFTVRFRDE